ncbi:hypothetical protein ISN44_Un143g000110 (mitochondrion) [Arabidopsis suecica]|uniref:Uncharacterized protein n=1 Tax=Arabidopsis suecica TaxID=45249 RepID=A0A8T1XFS8_ARASU|nr:hypothetical protein ISN44_Un143g000110 [Arabidopsis suecica]
MSKGPRTIFSERRTILPSRRLECSLPAEDRNCCAPRRAARLGMQRNYYRPAPYPNLMRRRIRTAGNRSMGGGTSNPFAAARLANRTQQARRPPGSGRHMSPNAMLNVRPTLRRYQCRDHQAALSLYRDRGGIAQFLLEGGWFARGAASVRAGGMDEQKVPWGEEYPESHVRQLNAPRGAAEELGDLLEHRIGN